MRRVRRLVAAIVAVATIAAVGTACAPERDAGWRPPSWDEAMVRAVDAPAAIDPATIAGLNPQRLRNDALGVQARWSLLPSSAATTALNARLERFARDAVSARAAATGATYHPAVFPRGAGLADRGCVAGSTARPAAELLADPAVGPAGASGTAVVCDVVAAAGTIFAERVRTVTGTSGVTADDHTETVFVDVATGEVETATGLWAPAAPAVLWSAIVEEERRAHGALTLSAVHPPDDTKLGPVRAALASVVPGRAGTLVVTVPPGLRAADLDAIGVAESASPRSYAVPASIAAEVLTPFGRRVLAAAGETFAAPAVVPAGFEPADCSFLPCVAMTYDDGPSPLTPGILDAIAAHHVTATFFAMGEKAAANAAVLRRALAEGNMVENHTWNHPHLPTLPPAAVAAQISDTQAALTAATGQTPKLFRPPYGDYDRAVLRAAGLPAILWNVDTFDWQHPDADTLVSRAVDGPAPQSIVLQHDIQQGTADTVSRVYDGLADRGFTLVTVQQLFGGTLPTSGAWRSAP